MRVPRVDPYGQPLGLRRVQQAQYEVMRSINEATISDIDGDPSLMPDERRRISAAAAQRGTWAPNEDDTGLVLMMDLQDGGRIPARWGVAGGGRTALAAARRSD